MDDGIRHEKEARALGWRPGRTTRPGVLAAAAICATLGLTPAAPPPSTLTGVTVPPDQIRPPQARPDPGHDFYFTRAIYSGQWGYGRRGSWAIDFPKADRQFLFILGRLMEVLNLYEWENPVRLDDPELRRFPFLYMLEVGRMSLTEPEVEGLRSYLEAGGFLVVDDFWGSWEWDNFEREIGRVLPGRPIVDLPMDHPIFHQFYDIDEILQVPNVGNGVRGGPYHERDGYVPHARGIFADDGRLMVVINWNTDLGDAWEWSENPYYPIDRSNFAYELAVNYIIYSMTH